MPCPVISLSKAASSAKRRFRDLRHFLCMCFSRVCVLIRSGRSHILPRRFRAWRGSLLSALFFRRCPPRRSTPYRVLSWVRDLPPILPRGSRLLPEWREMSDLWACRCFARFCRIIRRHPRFPRCSFLRWDYSAGRSARHA